MFDWLSTFWQTIAGNAHYWGLLAASPLIVIGLIGTILPVLPGTVIIACGFVLYGLIAGFDRLGPAFFLGQLLLIALSYLADFIATAFGVKVYGGSKAAVWGAVLGSLMLFVIGPLGLVVGPLAGAVLGELLAGRQADLAMRAGFGSFLGFLAGTLVKMLIGCLMTGWFFVRLFTWP